MRRRVVPSSVSGYQWQLHTICRPIWPFDATLVAQNEYGQGAWSSVIGIEIINEGGGISMDDLTNEEQCTYIAIHRHPWTAMDRDRDSGATEYEMSSALLSNTGKIFSAVQNN